MISSMAGVHQPQSTAGSEAAPSPKLVKAAHEFEAMLLQSWLEKMNQSFVGESGSLDPAHDTVSGLGTQAIAQALSAKGGIGIAKMILRQLAGHGQPAPAAQEVPSNVAAHQGTRMADKVRGADAENSAAQH